MNLLSTFVFCVCVRVYVCGFYNYLFFFSFVYCSVPSSSVSLLLLPRFLLCLFVCFFVFFLFRHLVLLFFFVFFFLFCSLFCPVTTRSLFLFSLSILANRFVRDRTPPVLPRNSPFLFSLSVALFRLPPVLPSHENYPETRESKRDREVRRGGI